MFRDARDFGFVPVLEAAFEDVLAELCALEHEAFTPSPDSLTTVAHGYDETDWHYYDLHGGPDAELHRLRCPRSARACTQVPGMVNAGFSRFGPGTHLFPHRGELTGVLRCHLPLHVPSGDLGLCGGGETRTWERGRCLVFDDTIEHEAWNHGDRDRVILLVTFRDPGS